MPQARMPRRQNHSFVKIDASSSYGSTYGGAEAFTPCQNPGAFDPSIEVWGYCDMWSQNVQPTEQECTAGGCRWYSYGWCDCMEKAGCLAVGGHWDSHTCENELDNLEMNKAQFEEARAQGSCPQNLQWQVAYPASYCCSDYPNTYCERNIPKMTPCKDRGCETGLGLL